MPPLEERLLDGEEMQLPRVNAGWGSASLSNVMRSRRSVREYSDEPLTLTELSSLLWATQGVNRVLGEQGNVSQRSLGRSASCALKRS